MAVSKVRKLELIAHAQCREQVLSMLRGLGSIHISDISDALPDLDSEPPSFLKSSLSQVTSRLDKIIYCNLFLERFMPKPSLVESLLKGKDVFSQQEVEDCVANFRLEELYEECTYLETELARNHSEAEKRESLIRDVAHWTGLDHPLELIADTKTTRVSLGICEARALKSMTDALAEASSLYHIEIIQRSRTSVAMVVAYLKTEEEVIVPTLRKFGWHAVQFAGLKDKPSSVVERLRTEIEDMRERIKEIKDYIKNTLVPHREQLLLLYDHYSQELASLKIQDNFLFTDKTFLVSGWVIAKREKELIERLREMTDIVEVRCSDPTPEEPAPILLDNHRMVQPFALVTELYGQPKYTEFDPTPLLAPFFAAFFGICLGDGGYGLILAIASLAALKILPVEGGARRLLQILMASGVATAIFGFLTGGVFGIETAKLPAFFQTLTIFNPTTEIIAFLYLSFAIGIFHILFGIGIRLTQNVYDRDIKSAVLEQGLWILFIICVAPLGFKYLFGGNVSEGIISPAVKGTALLGVLIVLFGARQITFKIHRIGERIGLRSPGTLRNVVDYSLSVAAFLLGRLSLGALFFFKSLIDYFGDVLSYSRLMALGLATAFLGMVINQMASLVLGFPYGIGIVAFVLILVFGHTFNLVINCLSAFVHTLRLQYLEFFSKFFAGGGEAFVPFAEARQYTVVQSGLRDA